MSLQVLAKKWASEKSSDDVDDDPPEIDSVHETFHSVEGSLLPFCAAVGAANVRPESQRKRAKIVVIFPLSR